MAVAYHALARAAGPFAAVREGFGPGDSVAVLGNGPLGILHGIMAALHGAGLSIATDLSDRRLAKAKELYADVTINAAQTSAEERVHQARELTEGVGPGLVIESAGDPWVFIEALETVRKGGTVIEVGNWVETEQTVPLNVMRHVRERVQHERRGSTAMARADASGEATEGARAASLVQAAAREGRIARRRTTPDELKALLGPPKLRR